MKKMKYFLRIGVMLIVAMAAVYVLAGAETPEAQNKSIFTRPLIWRSDSSANYSFKGAAFINAELASDGSVKTGASQGTCELPNPYKTEGLITGLSASWSFTGKVTLQVSITGNSKDYIQVTNGVPVIYKEPAYGSRIKWRASLAPDSALTELKITYSDLSGMAGTFGNELLSGFGYRKEIYMKGSTAGTLFNYQLPIRAGESQKSPAPYDFKLNGGILSDFADVRFTQSDGETILPHYLESVTGSAPNRIASFWVKIPEIPRDGLPIYMYYAKTGASDLSSGEKVFDFFDDFEGTLLNNKKWNVILDDKAGRADLQGSLLSLERARITSADYRFASGLIEYKARASAKGASAGIIRAASSGNDDVIAYSSVSSGASGHSIAKGAVTKANDPKPISPDIFYTYKIYCDDKGDIAFRRYGEDGSGTAQAETEYLAGTSGVLPIGLSSSIAGETMYCDWIRTRKAANPPPQVDPRTASMAPEGTNLPEFYNVSTAPDGSLISGRNSAGSYYISKLISPVFEARIIKPSWKADLADEGSASVGIATKNGGKFYYGWSNDIARYASKKEFDKGNQLRWKVVIASERNERSNLAFLQKFSLEYAPGAIRVVMPKGGETLAPGAKYTIFWEAPGYDPKYPMEIAYSKPESGKFEVIARKTDNSGDYAWDVPAGLSGKAMVKIADYYDKTVYGMSEDYFSIVSGAAPQEMAQGAEEAKLAEEVAPDSKPLAGYYDLLIKVGDNPLSNGYKDGDVVMVKPAGYLWGAEEKGKFLIVRARLTPERALELMKPEGGAVTAGRSGRKASTALKRRNYRFNLRNKITLRERAAASQGHLPGRPMEVPDITGMTEKK